MKPVGQGSKPPQTLYPHEVVARLRDENAALRAENRALRGEDPETDSREVSRDLRNMCRGELGLPPIEPTPQPEDAHAALNAAIRKQMSEGSSNG